MDQIQDMNERVEELIKRIISKGVVSTEDIGGCADDELNEIEKMAGNRLPYSYKLFMKRLGKSSDRLFDDACIYFDELKDLYLESGIIGDEEQHRLPDNGIPMWCDILGGQICYCLATDDDIDPPVYRFYNETNESVKVADSIWDCIEEEFELLEGLANDGQ